VDLTGNPETPMALAAKSPHVLSFDFAAVHGAPDGLDGPFRLPQALWPYVKSHTVYAQASPAAGSWRRGQIVWRATDTMVNDPNAPLGWVCTLSGQPGQWANVSSPLAVAAVSRQQEVSNMELQVQVTKLQEAVQKLLIAHDQKGSNKTPGS
jgi:hypothetical protein